MPRAQGGSLWGGRFLVREIPHVGLSFASLQLRAPSPETPPPLLRKISVTIRVGAVLSPNHRIIATLAQIVTDIGDCTNP
jgi:hypothetical protein